jgi:catechol 2,3-dioxygenase-like lactoylglutathione lyase family enzyme
VAGGDEIVGETPRLRLRRLRPSGTPPRSTTTLEVIVLDRFPVNPVLPAQDGDRARAFYRDVLGLALVSGATDDPMMFTAGAGTSIVVTELAERTPPPYPVVSFLVEGIEALVEELKARGATFAPLPGSASFAGQAGALQGEVMDFGAVKSAWLLDTEGNLLALNELVG